MLPFKLLPKFTSSLGAISLAIGCLGCSGPTSEISPSISEQNGTFLSPGMYLSIVAADNRPNNESAAKPYFEGAFGLAKANGLQEVQTFAVKKSLHGDETPQFLGIYSWPNKQAALSVSNSEEYIQQYKPLRESIWNELLSSYVEMEQPTTIMFDKNTTYTIAIVWFKNSNSYEEYAAATNQLRRDLGAKTVLREWVDRFDYLQTQKSLRKPDLVALLEWPNIDAALTYQKALASDEYAEMTANVFEKVEWLELQAY